MNSLDSIWIKEFAHLVPGYYLIKYPEYLTGRTLTSVSISQKHVLVAPDVWELEDADIRTLFAHEVAHILTDTSHDVHNTEWRNKCLELGGSGRITEAMIVSRLSPYQKELYKLIKAHNCQDNKVLSAAEEVELQKKAIDNCVEKGYDVTSILQMYVNATR
jgi:hypothetical protein